jgi:hypothetical protein
VVVVVGATAVVVVVGGSATVVGVDSGSDGAVASEMVVVVAGAIDREGCAAGGVAGGRIGAAATCGAAVETGRAVAATCSPRSWSRNCSSCSLFPRANSVWYSFSTSALPVVCAFGVELAYAVTEKPAARPAAETAPKNHLETIEPPPSDEPLWVVSQTGPV